MGSEAGHIEMRQPRKHTSPDLYQARTAFELEAIQPVAERNKAGPWQIVDEQKDMSERITITDVIKGGLLENELFPSFEVLPNDFIH